MVCPVLIDGLTSFYSVMSVPVNMALVSFSMGIGLGYTTYRDSTIEIDACVMCYYFISVF